MDLDDANDGAEEAKQSKSGSLKSKREDDLGEMNDFDKETEAHKYS